MRSIPAPQPDPVHRLATIHVPEAVRVAVEHLIGKAPTTSEARVLRLRFGLGVHPCRVTEIAQRLGIRVTTVLCLQARSLRTLRAITAELPAGPHAGQRSASPASTTLAPVPLLPGSPAVAPSGEFQPSGCPPARPARGTPP